MKVAVFADVHGNDHALDAVLDDIEKERVDAIICAGDMVNPFPGSERVWRTLTARHIPMVRGNHEDYILACHAPASDLPIRRNPQFLPVEFAARRLSTGTTAGIRALPMTFTLAGPGDDDVLVCHASPEHTSRSYCTGIDDDLAADLSRIGPKTIVGGHIHLQWQQLWRDKLLVVAGSVGLPFYGSGVKAQYAILTHRRDGWQVRHKSVAYNHQAALHDALNSNFLVEGGPLAWLMFDELLTAELRLVPFLNKFCPTPRPGSLPEWQAWVKRYLRAIGRWDALQPLLEGHSRPVAPAGGSCPLSGPPPGRGRKMPQAADGGQ